MNENSEEQSPTKEDARQADISLQLENVKSDSNNEKQMDIEIESSKNENVTTTNKRGNNSAKKSQQQRHQRAQEQTLSLFEEKKKLSREEMKYLKAIEILEKKEQDSKRKEENTRKRQKKDQETVQNLLGIEKSVSNENGMIHSSKSSPLPSPRRELTVEETVIPVQRTESQKKIDNRAFSKFLNPSFDLQGHLNLVAYINDYQANVFKQRVEEDSKQLLVLTNGTKKDQDFSSQKNNLIFDIKENVLSDQKSNLQQVSGKFTEYLRRNKQEGKFRDTTELLRGFKY